MTISEKVAYLKGLSEGVGIDKETKEGKILTVMLDILEDIGLSIADLEENELALGDEIDELADDLTELEEFVYDDEDEDCCCCDDDEDYFEVECPTCQEKIVIDDSMLEAGGLNCPNCNEKLEFDLSDCCCDD